MLTRANLIVVRRRNSETRHQRQMVGNRALVSLAKHIGQQRLELQDAHEAGPLPSEFSRDSETIEEIPFEPTCI